MKTLRFIIILLLISLAQHQSRAQELASYTFDPPIYLEELNSEDQEEAAPLITPKGDRMYFTRTNTVVQFDKPVSIHEIWFSDLLEGSWTKAVKAFNPLNDNQNTAVIGFKPEGLYLFGVYSGGLRNKNGASESHIENGAWTKPEPLEIPDLKIKGGYYGLSMHSSEKVLLVSKGESGNEDLFVTLQNTEGKWSELIDLGPVINSNGYEIAPFLSHDSFYLFFSRGTQTKDADIYVSRRIDNSWQKWTEPERLPEPINSDMFDAYFSINSDSTVLFSSDRLGSNDIYLSQLRMKRQLPTEVSLGNFESIPMEVVLDTPNVALTSEVIAQTEDKGMADGYVFFDFNESSLTDETKKVLDSVVVELKNDPNAEIEVVGHTDYIDQEDFNQKLSEKRSINVAEYLISKGIDANRLTVKAYGELLPISNNESEIGRKLNRRVEIYFISETSEISNTINQPILPRDRKEVPDI